jgi:hypothetical protein
MGWLRRILSGLIAFGALVVSVFTLRRCGRNARNMPAKTQAQHDAEMERISAEHDEKRGEIRRRYDGERDAFDRVFAAPEDEG